MKKLIVGALSSFLLYLVFRLAIVLGGLTDLVNPENFLFLGVSLAFCWTALLYVSGAVNFSIGVNLSWLSIALTALLFNLGNFASYWELGFYLFFCLFPLIFLLQSLFFSSEELKEKFIIRLSALVWFGLASFLASLSEILLF